MKMPMDVIISGQLNQVGDNVWDGFIIELIKLRFNKTMAAAGSLAISYVNNQ